MAGDVNDFAAWYRARTRTRLNLADARFVECLVGDKLSPHGTGQRYERRRELMNLVMDYLIERGGYD